MQAGILDKEEPEKNRKTILKEKKAKNKKKEKRKSVNIRKTKEGETLREVTVKIGLERIDTQEGIMVEALLDSRAMGLVMSLEFSRKQRFKLKKIK